MKKNIVHLSSRKHKPWGMAIITFCLIVLFYAFPLLTHAALFSDDQARRAIVELRKRLNDIDIRLQNKMDASNSLPLFDQNQGLSQDIAILRGQVEILTYRLDTIETSQKEFYTALDMRLGKLEPQNRTIDGQEMSVEPHEQQRYDAAMTLFKNKNYEGAITSFTHYLQYYPNSGYTPSILYSLGVAYYAKRDYKNAVATHQNLIKQYPDSPKAAEAYLSVAASYTELKDNAHAKKTLHQLIKKYPNSPAAATAKKRLILLK